jgi:hypothetical protein
MVSGGSVAGLLTAWTGDTMLTEHDDKRIAKLYISTMDPANTEATCPRLSQVNCVKLSSTFSSNNDALVWAFNLQFFSTRSILSHSLGEPQRISGRNPEVHFKYSYTRRFTSACDADRTSCPCGQGQTTAGSVNALTNKTGILCL